MLDELKLIIEAIAGLPTITVWVLCGFLVYKLAIVGSCYGLIRFSVEKLHDFLVRRKTERREETVELVGTINGMCITQDSSNTALIGQLMRIRGKGTGIGSEYIHKQSVEWLQQAIDAKELDDFEKTKKKQPS